MTKRERIIVVALGAPSMGKTRLVNALVDRYPASAGTVRALDPAGQWDWGEWPGGSQKLLKAWLQELKGENEDGQRIPGAERHRGLLILDDCDRYISNSSFVRDGWRDLLVANRHYHLDIAATAHRPQGVPKDMLASATELWLFAQEEPLALEYLRKIPTLAGTFAQNKAPLPVKAGLALRVRPRAREVKLVKLF